MSRAAPKVKAMACVRVGYIDMLLPADLGMRLVEILQSAFLCDREYGDREYSFTPRDQPQVELQLVRASQLRAARSDVDEPAAPLQLAFTRSRKAVP